MANLVVCAWLVTVLGATVVLLTAAVLPRWVKVCANMDGMVEEADVGLWQMCRPHNCTTLTTSTTAGWFHNVQILSVASCATMLCCAFSLCIIVARYECGRVRPHTMVHVVLSVMLLAAGLLQLVAVIFCGINVCYSLPVCINFCPAYDQPLPTCPVDVLPSTTQCQASTASGYVIAAVGAGLALTSGLVGVAMSRDQNGDDDEPLLDGVADVVTSEPTDSSIT